jgi:hypothetical protein
VTQITGETGKQSDLDDCIETLRFRGSEDRKIGVGVVPFVGL